MNNDIYVVLSQNYGYIKTLSKTEFDKLIKITKARVKECEIVSNVHICVFNLYVPKLKQLIRNIS